MRVLFYYMSLLKDGSLQKDVFTVWIMKLMYATRVEIFEGTYFLLTPKMATECSSEMLVPHILHYTIINYNTAT
jgi:hypothetical protein